MTGIAEVETGILARLKAAGEADVLGYRYRTLESYPEEFDTYLREQIKGDAFPAAWVIFGGWRQPEDAGSSVQCPAVFMLVVAAENLRNEKAQRHGVATDKGLEVGSYQLVRDAAALLHGQDLGLDISALELGPCRSIRPTAAIQQRKVSMFALEFATRLPIDVTGFATSDLADFSTFNADWDLPPFGNVATELPAPAEGEGAADATDTLTLETTP